MLVRNSATTLVNIRRRARRLEAAGRLIEAEGEYRRLLQSASSVPGRGADRDRARMVRNASRMHWLGSRFDSAAFGFASLLKEARARGRPEDPMALVWRYLSLARLDPAAALAELRQRPPMAHAHRGSWAASILELFCGRMPPAEFSASVAALRARTSPRVTPHVAPHVANRQMGDLPRSARVAAAIENFYLGQWCLLHGHALAARMHLSAAAGLGGKFESCAAAVERQRLQAGHVAGTRA
ncbi:MAG: hypothetical protein ACKVQQ_18290 [Burkholderiales bacterium]